MVGKSAKIRIHQGVFTLHLTGVSSIAMSPIQLDNTIIIPL